MGYELKICECGNYVEGNTDYCASCNRANRKAEADARKNQAKFQQALIKKQKPRSEKRAKEEAQYLIEARLYLLKNKYCKVIGCGLPSTQVHHKAGRIGKLLLYKPFWMATCDDCHRKIENNPEWAKENEYSLDRINIDIKSL